jgi:hypothetical protein
VGIFSGKTDKPKPAEPTAMPASPPGQKKSAPTPSRAAAERARMERLNPTLDPKQAKARERAITNVERAKAMERADQTPGKILMRKVIDSRFNLGDFATPIMLAALVLTMFSSLLSQEAQGISMIVVYLVFLALVIDMAFIWLKYRKLARERIPGEPRRGLLFYGINRAITFRRMRVPAVVAKRGDPI